MSSERSTQSVDDSAIRQVLGESSARLIDAIARHAQQRELSLYIVGGVVRDIFLGLPNHDLDFVLEADAIHFADELAARCGGSVLAHKPFGTAVWSLDSKAANELLLAEQEIPQHIDFACARRETYSQPAALPSTEPADIWSDLRRRDFTLNTLAIQLSPASESSRLLDICGGYSDLENGLIRVLHDRSFIDDPTRILRAVRLAARLGFDIETDTDSLMKAALPTLGRVTGQRLASEFDLIIREHHAGNMLLQLQKLGALHQVAPAFRISRDLPNQLRRLREAEPVWKAASDTREVAWCLLLATVKEDDAYAICQRLDLTRKLTKTITACSRLMSETDALRDPLSPPSESARLLDGLPESALRAAWLILAECPVARKKLANYLSIWQHQQTSIRGSDLEQMGIPPGPRYKQLLDALRYGWIDGRIRSAQEEQDYLRELLSADD